MDEGTRIGRSLLEAFANALLERALPRIRQWLAQRLGPDAELGALELEGARIHLVDARLPLGERALLHATRATFATHPEELALGHPPIELERLEGRLAITHPRGALSAEVSFEGAATGAGDAWVDGRLALREVAVADPRFAGSAAIRVTSDRFAIDDAIVTSLETGARIELGAGGTLGAGSYRVERARLEAHAITAGLLMELARLVRGVDLPSLPMAEDARASLIAALERDGSMHALATIEAAGGRAELRGRGRIDRDGLSGEADGTIEPGLLRVRSTRMRGEPLALSATLSGTRAEPVLILEAMSARLEPAAGLALRRVRASGRIDHGVELEVRALTERGAISLRRSRDGELRAKLERVPLSPLRSSVGASWLAALGADEGELFAELSGTSEGVIGQVHVATPQASVTLAPMRAALGLRRIELEGTLRAAVRAEALAQRIARGVGLHGMIELELAIERACLARGALEALEGRGVARARALSVRVPSRSELAIRDASARIELERGAVRLEDARARVLGGLVRARGLARAGQAVITELVLEGVRGLGRWSAGLSIEEEVIDAVLTRAEGALRGVVTARTQRSAIEAQLVIADTGALDGSRLSGALAVADLAPLMREWSIRPDEGGRWSLEGAIEGTLLEPVLALEGRSEAQPLWIVTHTSSVRVEGQGARARARIEGGGIAWSELSLSLYGGTLRSRGRYAGGVLGARVEIEDVDAGALPLPRGTLGAHLGGRLGATLDLLRRSDADAIGCVRVSVEAPVYRALERAAATMRKLGLPMPDLRGSAPFEARVQLGPAGWRVCGLDARLAELSVSGSVDIGREGALRGRLSVRPAPSWLRASAYLTPLSELAAAVPVRISGWLGAPRLDASALSMLEAALERSPLAEIIQALTGELDPSEPARRDAIGSLSTEALFERLAHAPAAPEPLAELIGRGLDVEDIAARLRRR